MHVLNHLTSQFFKGNGSNCWGQGWYWPLKQNIIAPLVCGKANHYFVTLSDEMISPPNSDSWRLDAKDIFLSQYGWWNWFCLTIGARHRMRGKRRGCMSIDNQRQVSPWRRHITSSDHAHKHTNCHICPNDTRDNQKSRAITDTTTRWFLYKISNMLTRGRLFERDT